MTGGAHSLESAVRSVRRAATARRHPLVLIDGPSGAGKSTFAAQLARVWPGAVPTVLRVDEAIPGWHGLRPGADTLGTSLLAPLHRGRMGAVHRWDWPGDRPGEVRRIRPGHTVILEGCGAFLAGRGRPDAIRVWLDAPYAERRERALTRDRGAFDPHWDGWEADWRRYLEQAGVRGIPALRVRLGDRAARGT